MNRPWWESAVLYQVYPRSFADGNGDGIGDLWGVIDRLEYLEWLGIDALWLSPHFPSPQADFGYDVSDYCDVEPAYGDLDVFRRLLDEAHARGIRIVLDLVVNHSSDRHPWFVASRSSRRDPKRDWYVWHPGGRDSDGTPTPPNNWVSTFGGPAWTWDETTQEWYYHFFLRQQPDLNWRNPEVREAMWSAVRFWLDLGVDGFRLDAIGTLFEDPTLADQEADFRLIDFANQRFEDDPDAEPLEWRDLMSRQVNLPEVHDAMQELRAVIDEYDGRVLVAETDDLSYHGDGTNEVHMVFNFPLMRLDRLTAEDVRANQRERLAGIPEGSWPCNTSGNHDARRAWSRLADGEHDADWARISAALTMLLQGTPSLYQGEEIGMVDLLATHPDDLLDPIGPWFYETAVAELGMHPDIAAKRAAHYARDRSRSPMQWTAGVQAGFSPNGAPPWLPVHPNHEDGVNVADQRNDPDSLLTFYRTLIQLRREHVALRHGTYAEVAESHEDVLEFTRSGGGQTLVVAMNLADAELEPQPAGATVYSSAGREGGTLAPYEIRISTPAG